MNRSRTRSVAISFQLSQGMRGRCVICVITVIGAANSLGWMQRNADSPRSHDAAPATVTQAISSVTQNSSHRYRGIQLYGCCKEAD